MKKALHSKLEEPLYIPVLVSTKIITFASHDVREPDFKKGS